jgi:hypothetical protein
MLIERCLQPEPMRRRLRERKPQPVQTADSEVEQPEDSEETAEESEEESEQESEEEFEDEERSRDKGRGRSQARKPGKRKSCRAGQTSGRKKPRRGTVADAQREAELAARQVAVLQARVDQLEAQAQQQQSYHMTPGPPEPRPQATQNTAQSAILQFAAQNMRADAIDRLAAALQNTPRSGAIDNLLAHLHTPGIPQLSGEVD